MANNIMNKALDAIESEFKADICFIKKQYYDVVTTFERGIHKIINSYKRGN